MLSKRELRCDSVNRLNNIQTTNWWDVKRLYIEELLELWAKGFHNIIEFKSNSSGQFNPYRSLIQNYEVIKIWKETGITKMIKEHFQKWKISGKIQWLINSLKHKEANCPYQYFSNLI